MQINKTQCSYLRAFFVLQCATCWPEVVNFGTWCCSLSQRLVFLTQTNCTMLNHSVNAEATPDAAVRTTTTATATTTITTNGKRNTIINMNKAFCYQNGKARSSKLNKNPEKLTETDFSLNDIFLFITAEGDLFFLYKIDDLSNEQVNGSYFAIPKCYVVNTDVKFKFDSTRSLTPIIDDVQSFLRNIGIYVKDISTYKRGVIRFGEYYIHEHCVRCKLLKANFGEVTQSLEETIRIIGTITRDMNHEMKTIHDITPNSSPMKRKYDTAFGNEQQDQQRFSSPSKQKQPSPRQNKEENPSPAKKKAKFLNDNIVTINAGGRVFATNRDTVLCDVDGDETHMLYTMFHPEISELHMMETDKNGNIFLDIDSQAFAIILDYMRSRCAPHVLEKVCSGPLKHQVANTARFLGMHNLAERVSKGLVIPDSKIGYFALLENDTIPTSEEEEERIEEPPYETHVIKNAVEILNNYATWMNKVGIKSVGGTTPKHLALMDYQIAKHKKPKKQEERYKVVLKNCLGTADYSYHNFVLVSCFPVATTNRDKMHNFNYFEVSICMQAYCMTTKGKESIENVAILGLLAAENERYEYSEVGDGLFTTCDHPFKKSYGKGMNIYNVISKAMNVLNNCVYYGVVHNTSEVFRASGHFVGDTQTGQISDYGDKYKRKPMFEVVDGCATSFRLGISYDYRNRVVHFFERGKLLCSSGITSVGSECKYVCVFRGHGKISVVENPTVPAQLIEIMNTNK